MIFIANSLPLNGGSTFLIRICKKFSFETGVKPSVLVLVDRGDDRISKELEKWANVKYLKDFVGKTPVIFERNQLCLVANFDWSALKKFFEEFGPHVHVMGIFGLLFMHRLYKKKEFRFKLSVGIYHQNEFLYQGVDFYFSNKAKEILAELPLDNMVFFNEFTLLSYCKFFKLKNGFNNVIPIGIDVPLDAWKKIGNSASNRIVSIGNLVNFKKYNEQVIRLIPQLLSEKPDLVYEIYGSGENESYLRKLVKENNLENFVSFKGTIDYSDFAKTLEGCLLFVGSGTAILEASIYGIPSLIGIESLNGDPRTYGFICDIEGLSYNEIIDGVELFPMIDKIKFIFNEDNWTQISNQCKSKALSFSIDNTIEGFFAIEKKLDFYKSDITWSDYKYFYSFACSAFLHVTGFNREFALRRDQGSVF